MEKRCFGVDIGGTTVKMGLFTVDGKVTDKWEIPTRKEENGKYILSYQILLFNKKGCQKHFSMTQKRLSQTLFRHIFIGRI